MRSGAKWSLIRLNVVDYVLDGFQFTNKDYITCESEIKEDTILHRILSIKNKKDNIRRKDDEHEHQQDDREIH